SPLHHPIDRWVKPEEFVELSDKAREIGFAGVMAGPLVRSSYRAGKLFVQALGHRGQDVPSNLQHLTAEGSAAQEASSVLARSRACLPRRGRRRPDPPGSAGLTPPGAVAAVLARHRCHVSCGAWRR